MLSNDINIIVVLVYWGAQQSYEVKCTYFVIFIYNYIHIRWFHI